MASRDETFICCRNDKVMDLRGRMRGALGPLRQDACIAPHGFCSARSRNSVGPWDKIPRLSCATQAN
ncbi:hypothetical protein BN1182_BI_00200 [Pantoea ananatis]|nr:hypothetical protein BN1182_BI_00200 [Pantoea ananatis]CRH34212.1 hypothetical protein BN1183_BA_00910 [Pantoea ananatis]